MVLQLLFSTFARRSHGLARKSTRKHAVRLGHRATDETESRRHGRPASDTARRVSPAAAARRQRPDRAGHAASGHAFKSPELARNAQRLHFRFPGSSFSIRSARKHSSSAAVAVDGTSLA